MSNATNSEDRLESILDQVRVLKAKYDERAEVTGENFNVFSILDRESDEVKTHSAIIAELLNPHGSHSQRTLFLKLFLGKLLKKLQKEQKVQEELKQLREKLKQIQEQENDEFDKFRVEVETSKKDKEGEALGRIDILIESHGIESGDVCIVIENKIYAEDQERQLGRYYEYALDTGKKRGIVYLTLWGDEPKKFTLYGSEPDKMSCCRMLPEDTVVCPRTHLPPTPPSCRMLPKDIVVCLSYKDFIVKWLDNCIKEVARIPQIRETLHQYQILLKELTGQPINRRFAMELKNILLKDENYNLIPDLEAAISEAKAAFQHDIWTKLEEQLKAQEELNIEDENLRHEVDWRSPGLTFRFPESENETYEVVFRIADDQDKEPLYYGFALRENGKRVEIDEEKLKKYPYLKQFKIDGGADNYPSGWLTYKYFPKINFANFTFVTEHKERKREDCIQKLVENLVKEICKVIPPIKKRVQWSAPMK